MSYRGHWLILFVVTTLFSSTLISVMPAFAQFDPGFTGIFPTQVGSSTPLSLGDENDADGDGVSDDEDPCPGTTATSFPLGILARNGCTLDILTRGGSGVFDITGEEVEKPVLIVQGTGPVSDYTIHLSGSFIGVAGQGVEDSEEVFSVSSSDFTITGTVTGNGQDTFQLTGVSDILAMSAKPVTMTLDGNPIDVKIDTDNDGVHDVEDECPTDAGTHNGCEFLFRFMTVSATGSNADYAVFVGSGIRAQSPFESVDPGALADSGEEITPSETESNKVWTITGKVGSNGKDNFRIGEDPGITAIISIQCAPQPLFDCIGLYLSAIASDRIEITYGTSQVDVSIDQTPPIISLAGDNPLTLEAGDTYTEAGATATDNEPGYGILFVNRGDPPRIITVGGDTVDTSTVGTYVLTYDAPPDLVGNVPEQVTRTVNVVESTPPIISLNGENPITLELGIDTYTEQGATVTDNDPAYAGTVAVGGDTVDTSTVGTYIVTYNAPADPSGNVPSQVTRTVNVVDTIPPVISLNGDKSVTLEGGFDAYTESGATVSDNDPAYAGTVAVGGDTVDTSTVGIYVITYDADQDASGNTPSQVTRTVNVVDTTPPSLTVPADVIVEATALNTPLSDVHLGIATATDIVDPEPTVTNDAPLLFQLGLTIVQWRATDFSGNSAPATQEVTVQDTTPPSITIPADIAVECTSPSGQAVDFGQATATDAVDSNPTVTNDAPSLFSLGTTTVIWTATDFSGNSAPAPQEVVVEDTTPPSITPPSDMTVIANTAGGWSGDIGQPAYSDICSTVVISNDAPAVFSLAVGESSNDTVVTWTASDSEGNSASATQTITVLPLPVSIDIKPGSDPNCFNNDGKGVIPVAILGSDTFDATQVDPVTVTLDNSSVKTKGKGDPHASIEDVNGDEFDDLSVKIIDTDGTYQQGQGTATLAGQLFNGIPIEGTDSICVTQ